MISSEQNFSELTDPESIAEITSENNITTKSILDFDTLLQGTEDELYSFEVDNPTNLQPTFTLDKTPFYNLSFQEFASLSSPESHENLYIQSSLYPNNRTDLPSTFSLPNEKQLFFIDENTTLPFLSNEDETLKNGLGMIEQKNQFEDICEETYLSNKRKNGNKLLPKKKTKDDKYSKRLEANKKSAQASRQRKKALKIELEAKLAFLSKENADILSQMASLETENKVLKTEFIELQGLISNASKSFELDNTNLKSNSSIVAMLYLLVVLYSFRGHFAPSSLPNSVNPI